MVVNLWAQKNLHKTQWKSLNQNLTFNNYLLFNTNLIVLKYPSPQFINVDQFTDNNGFVNFGTLASSKKE